MTTRALCLHGGKFNGDSVRDGDYGPDGQENGQGTWQLPKTWGQLPDDEVCRARRKTKGGEVYCLVSNAYICKHVTRVDYDLICSHPQKEEIVAMTEAERQK
jgi:hypothetical protein